METRQTAKEGTATDTFMGNNTDFFNSSGNNLQDIPQQAVVDMRQNTAPHTTPGWPVDFTDISSVHYIQHMQEVDATQWRGGENFYGGKHDNFCYVCGSSMELFPCQTCSTSYHASCMSPSLGPDEVPPFWFCPHCVDDGFNMPPTSSTSYFTPVSPGPPVYPSPYSPNGAQNQEHSQKSSGITQTLSPSEQSQASLSHRPVENPTVQKSTNSQPPTVVPTQAPRNEVINSRSLKGNTNRSKRSYSPPRKKSKYSAFSAEVDKALAIIQKELEVAAQIGKSEDSLRDAIEGLEQQLKLKDSQIQLTSRELELAKIKLCDNGAGAAGLIGLKDENSQLREENAKLKEMVVSKDAELKNWRAKLKSMMGSDLE